MWDMDGTEEGETETWFCAGGSYRFWLTPDNRKVLTLKDRYMQKFKINY